MYFYAITESHKITWGLESLQETDCAVWSYPVTPQQLAVGSAAISHLEMIMP